MPALDEASGNEFQPNKLAAELHWNLRRKVASAISGWFGGAVAGSSRLEPTVIL